MPKSRSMTHCVRHLMGLWPTVLCSAAVIVGCGKRTLDQANEHASPAEEPWFRNVSEQWGIDFVHDAGDYGEYWMPESIGSGAAVFDLDNDGLLDVYLLQNGGPDSQSSNRLFRQVEVGRFQDVSADSGVDVCGHGMGAAVGDVNNDGWPDLCITEYQAIRLFQNQRDGTFREITMAAGLENPHWGCSAAFTDFNRDGWLDLIVANYVAYEPTQQCTDRAGKREYCGPSGFPPSVARLFQNLGSAPDGSVRFQDVTLPSGIAQVPGPGLGVVCADFNGDRWPDIFIADDAAANRLWINQQDGTFHNEAVIRGIGYNAMGKTQANMGVAIGDVDRDGLFDVFVTHLNTESHTLWRQGPTGYFQDQTADARIMNTQWRATAFGTALADFDHDGALDLCIVNGAIKRSAAPDPATTSRLGPHWSRYAVRDQLLANDGAGRFVDISSGNSCFCGTPAVGRGLAVADFDNDGGLDLLVTNINGHVNVFRNECARGHWLLVRATDPELGGRDAYGAEITVTVGGQPIWRLLNPGYSFLCSNDPRCHFGLGQHRRVDAIHVVWPDGTQEQFGGFDADQVVVLRKGAIGR